MMWLGAGKSTIMNLLLRFYDPQSGDILLDGCSIRELNLRYLRSQFGYVGQEPVLFSGTITENISYGIPPEEREAMSAAELRSRVEEAAQLANAHDFITQFPCGYDTDVGSNGVAMSGGQKQRIAIARALIKRPAVLLLDEATSALDMASERVVQESIDKLQQMKSQTTLIIAHRLSTIRNADKIAVVNDGVIAELGCHEDLIALGGIYKELVSLQLTSEEEQVEAPDDIDDPMDNASQLEESNDIVSGRKLSSANAVIANSEIKMALTKEESTQLSRRIWALVLHYKFWLSVTILGSMVFGSVYPVWGLLLAKTQTLFYYSDTQRMRSTAANVALYFFLLAIGCLVGGVLEFGGIAQVGERVSAKLRGWLFEALLRREIAYFDREENSIGALTSRLSDDSRMVNKATGEAVAKELQALFTLAIGVGIAFSASWKVSLVTLSTFPLTIAAAALQNRRMRGQQYDTKTSGDAGAVIAPAFTHIRTFSAFSMHKYVSEILSSN